MPKPTPPAPTLHRRIRGLVSGAEGDALLAPLLLVLSVFVLHGRRSWWEMTNPDELDVLGQALEFSLLEILFSPEKYQTLTTGNFTPLVTLSVKLDTILFGLWLPGYTAHSFLSISVALVLFYRLLRTLSVPTITATAAALFMVSSPVVEEWAAGLHLRHYVEGFVFAVASILLAIRGSGIAAAERTPLHRASMKWMLPAAGFYLLACLAKEIYVAIPFLLLAMPIEKVSVPALTRRLVWLSPMLAIFPVYLLWRLFMLSGFGGNNPVAAATDAASILDLARRAQSLGSRIVEGMHLGFGTQLGALLLLICAVTSVPFLLRRRSFPVTLVAAFVGFSALLFVFLEFAVGIFGLAPRWLTLLSFGLAGYVAWAYGQLGPRANVAAATLLAGLAIQNAALVPPKYDSQLRDMTMAGFAFARDSGPGEVLYLATNDGLTSRHLSGIAVKGELFQGREAGIASSGPIVNHVLGLEGRECRIVGGPEMYAAAPPEVCFEGKKVVQLAETGTGDALSGWFSRLAYDDAEAALFVQATAARNVHIVIHDGDRYVHAITAWIFPLVLSRPNLRRSWVEPARASIVFAVEEEDRYLVTASMPLAAIRGYGVGND